MKGKVEFRNVGFDFANATQGVRDVSFTVEAGQTVAIVGPTGAGKAALVNLLQRVYEPQSGQILIDGIDISTVNAQVAAPLDRDRLPGCRPAQPLDLRQYPSRPRGCDA